MTTAQHDSAVGFLKEVSRDARRVIYEWNAPEFGISFTSFEVLAAIPLGNHHHTKKAETFHITAGSGVVVMQDVDPDSRELVGVRRITPLKAGCVVHVKAFVAHTLILEPGSRMTCHSTSHFDQANMDMPVVKLVANDEAAALLAETPKL